MVSHSYATQAMKQRTVKVTSAKVGISTETLEPLCWARGFKGVPGLAKHIKRDRNTVWRAVRWPDQFGPTFKLITEALNAN